MSIATKTVLLGMLSCLLWMPAEMWADSPGKVMGPVEGSRGSVVKDTGPREIEIDPESPRGVIMMVVERLRSVKHPASGKGTALVKSQFNDEISEKIVDFMFKDRMCRSDKFAVTDGEKDRREVSWAVGSESSIYYHGDGRVFMRAALASRKFGEDFHPDTLLRYSQGQQLAEHLERIAKNPDRSSNISISTRSDSNGILHIISDYGDDKQHQHGVVSVDPAKEYRVVSMEFAAEHPGRPERDRKRVRRLQWDKYGSEWYIKSYEAEYEGWTKAGKTVVPAKKDDRPGRKGRPERKGKRRTVTASEGQPYNRRIEITVTQFRPNVEIKDSEFTFMGFDLPKGTRVRNRIDGELYEYDGTPVLRKIEGRKLRKVPGRKARPGGPEKRLVPRRPAPMPRND